MATASRRIRGRIMRVALVLHRWLGITCGWLLLAWCLSGLVMMYVMYPAVGPSEQRAALATLDLQRCCRLDDASFAPQSKLWGARVEMLAGRPIARLEGVWPELVDLDSGRAIEVLSDAALHAVADSMQHPKSDAQPEFLGWIDIDQWTILVRQHAPLAAYALGDDAGTHIYLSATGELVQRTTTAQRFWNWLGSVTHWIYPTLLRQHTAAWIQVIIWASLLGIVTTLLGLMIGLLQFKRRRDGRWSPYRGIAWWHHTAGLAFGVLALTWLASGFLSVTPWGLLESPGAGPERRQLEHSDWTVADFEQWLSSLQDAALPADTVRIETAPFGGQMAYIVHTRRGERLRLDRELRPAPLGLFDLRAAATTLHPSGLAASALLDGPDAYYFDHHSKRTFPVFRAVAADEQRTRYYFDPVTGELLLKADRPQRWFRWLFEGLHRFDFTAGMRARPIWDLIMWCLMVGVTAVCFTGTYMGIRYLRR